jgi:hypothetical protein
MEMDDLFREEEEGGGESHVTREIVQREGGVVSESGGGGGGEGEGAFPLVHAEPNADPDSDPLSLPRPSERRKPKKKGACKIRYESVEDKVGCFESRHVSEGDFFSSYSLSPSPLILIHSYRKMRL